MSKYILVLFFIFYSFNIVIANDKLIYEYDNLLCDLRNHNSIGYKSIDLDILNNNLYIFKQGPLAITYNNKHFAILGKGFFKVIDEKNNKIYFTRCGKFKINSNGSLITNEGFKLISELKEKDNKIYFTDDKFDINSNGSFITNEGFKLISELKEKDLKSNNISYLINENIQLFIPKHDSSIKRINQYFIFDNFENCYDSKIMVGFLELSTTDIEKTIIRMIFILNKSKKHHNDIKDIETKIMILNHLLNNILIINDNIEIKKYLFSLEKKINKTEVDKMQYTKVPRKRENYIKYLELYLVIDDFLLFLDREYE